MFAGWFQSSIDGKQATSRCSGLGQPISWLPFYGSGIWTGLSLGFPGDSDGKESACNERDQGSVPGLGRPPGEGTGNPLLYSCLETSMDRGGWQAIQCIWAWKQSDTTERPTHTFLGMASLMHDANSIKRLIRG